MQSLCDRRCSKAALSVTIPNHNGYNGPHDEIYYNGSSYSPVSPFTPLSQTIHNPFPPNTFEHFTGDHEKIASVLPPVALQPLGKQPVGQNSLDIILMEQITGVIDSGEDEELFNAEDHAQQPFRARKPIDGHHRMVIRDRSINFDEDFDDEGA
jgi:hypothetical protein